MTEVKVKAAEKEHSRGKWTGKLDFVMSAMSFAVGMGNVWRFPYMCYRNGGGAFLIPYLLMVVFTGFPLMFLELSFGQYGSQGVISIWKAVPIFQGIGWTMFAISFISCIYYNMLVAYSFYYLFASFQSDVPWRGCDNDWNTEQCGSLFKSGAEKNCSALNGTWWNTTCYGSLTDVPAQGQAHLHNLTALNLTDAKRKYPADEYFHHNMLGISSGLDDIGAPRWQLALCLLLCWSIVFICLSRGIKSFGKATYVTSVFPYVILIILLVRGLTLEGSVEGIIYYLTPDFSQLGNAKVWGDAAVQVFFSMSTCWGGLITLASYNKFNNNCLRDAIIVATGDCLTSIFAGVVIFSIIGYMAHEMGLPISEVATQGAGLAFIVYPSAVTKLPVSPLWSILFMLMLLNLGIGTQFTLVTTSHTTLMDVFPKFLRKGRRSVALLATICIFSYLVGLTMTTNAGMYILQLMDTYAPSYALLTAGLCETIAIGWVYGMPRYFKNIEEMLGYKPSKFWMIVWKFVTPILIVAILLFTFIDFKRSSYGEYQYPLWGDLIGWAITILEISFIPGVAVYKVMTADSALSIIERIKLLSRPAADWGRQDLPPYVMETRHELTEPLNDVTSVTHRSNGKMYTGSQHSLTETKPLAQHENGKV